MHQNVKLKLMIKEVQGNKKSRINIKVLRNATEPQAYSKSNTLMSVSAICYHTIYTKITKKYVWFFLALKF